MIKAIWVGLVLLALLRHNFNDHSNIWKSFVAIARQVLDYSEKRFPCYLLVGSPPYRG